MQKYNCIIVEDEPLAAEVLQDYIRQVSFLELKSVCNDAVFALEVMRIQPVDLIFLDIHLPKLKGLEFIKSLGSAPHIIITTAYPDYALQGFEMNVTDYLLKPIEFTRFLSAVNKVKTPKDMKPGNGEMPEPAEKHQLFFNVDKKKVRIAVDEILYIESLKEYIRITTRTKSIITKFQLSQVESLLTNGNFLRVHRSFIVALDKIDSFNSIEIEINKKQIPVGRSYKDILAATLK